MRRRLLNLLTAGSLVLFLTTVVLWVRSYRSLDQYSRLDRGTGRLEEVALLYGAAQVARAENVAGWMREANLDVETGWTAIPLKSFARAPSADWQVLDNRNAAPRLQFLGVRWLTGSLGPSQPLWSVRIPLWFPACLFALLPALSVVKRRRRPGRGRCPRCGYDLRATPEKCPECGTQTVGG